MKRPILLILGWMNCVLLWAQFPTSTIDSLVQHTLSKGSDVGIAIYDLTDGQSLYEHRIDQLGHPASNMKLLTAITTLLTGADQQPFRTEVWSNGRIEADTLYGDLYVVGAFDPELDEEAMHSLVKQLHRKGISSINGTIYGDVSMKDSLYWGMGWMWDDEPTEYQPYLSPLLFHKGMVSITARPADNGEPAQVKLKPASAYYTLTNATDSENPAAGTFNVTRNWLERGNHITVSGNVNRNRSTNLCVYSSKDQFMTYLLEELGRREITVSTSGYRFAAFPRQEDSKRLAYWETPVDKVMKQALLESDNLNAEALLFHTAWVVTGAKHLSGKEALQPVHELIRRCSLNPDDYILADGSGMSCYNYVSPRLLLESLKLAYADKNLYKQLLKYLPLSGVRGTLKNRMKGDSPAHRKVHAKTGTLSNDFCLSGYAKDCRGHIIAFAIMNQNALSDIVARRFQDNVCEIITGIK